MFELISSKGIVITSPVEDDKSVFLFEVFEQLIKTIVNITKVKPSKILCFMLLVVDVTLYKRCSETSFLEENKMIYSSLE
tara:strand:+ start:830 stop:1069 length:240 start_codon:yes stop_codon:yes gene_type:complete